MWGPNRTKSAWLQKNRSTRSLTVELLSMIARTVDDDEHVAVEKY
jgi:hypothetical protein